jgi:poly(3-hydroxybutyrate) depolymerase
VSVCSNVGPGPFLGPPDALRSITAARTAAVAGGIDGTSGLRGGRVFLFSGRLDTFVPTSVMEAVQRFYRVRRRTRHHLCDKHRRRPRHGHQGIRQRLQHSEPPHLNACGFDLAGAALAHIYRSLDPPKVAAGELLAFDQTEFAQAAERYGLAPTGYAYVPEACQRGGGCRLHVAFHGCLQNVDSIGDAFIRHAGYNEWGEANRIIVLYPQAAAVTRRIAGVRVGWPNPQGCWDWWGFTGGDFARKSGPQLSAINAMIDRLAGRGDVDRSSASPPSCDPTSRG